MNGKRYVVSAIKIARGITPSARLNVTYRSFAHQVPSNRYFEQPLISQAARNFCSTSGKNKDDDVLEHQPNREMYSDVPGVKTEGEKMIIMFTCTVCDTRSARKISKIAYTQGIVMVRCGGCKNRHLIADRMGVFEDSIDDGKGGLAPGTGWDIQKYLAKEMGETSRYITEENVYELTVDDIVGAKAAAQLAADLDKK